MSVRIDGQPSEVHESTVAGFAIFPFEHPAKVEIDTNFDVRWADVRPLSAGATAVVSPSHRNVTFELSSLVPLTVEFNDDLSHVLHLFPFRPVQDAPTAVSPNVRYFGPGVFKAGLIELHSGESVYLAPGAWVQGLIRARGARHIRIFGSGS